jgi:hypothetical protein
VKFHSTIATVILLVSAQTSFADWMMSLMRPDFPTSSCCGPREQVFVDSYQGNADGGFTAIIAGEEVNIPHEKVIWDRVNPTGRGVLFWSKYEVFGKVVKYNIFCFVPGLGT